MIKAAVLGYGTVGSGVVEVLHKNKDIIAKRVGQEIEVKYILDLRDFPGDPFEDKVVHQNPYYNFYNIYTQNLYLIINTPFLHCYNTYKSF